MQHLFYHSRLGSACNYFHRSMLHRCISMCMNIRYDMWKPLLVLEEDLQEWGRAADLSEKLGGMLRLTWAP